jgi:hypothetical protein
MAKANEITIPREDVREVLRRLGELEGLTCRGCVEESHDSSCPAQRASQLVNRLSLRLNHGR